jgi:pSer/pThr/pTyr-binding forkhead associated (FHA) protein
MNLCPQCGEDNETGNRFCTGCGSRLLGLINPRLLLLDDGPEAEYAITETERLIGRGPGNDIVIDDAEMSTCHARIRLADGECWIEDQHSTNGTFVNGLRIHAATCLSQGDLLKLGRTFLKFVG